MNNELIKLIKEEIDRREESIKEVSIKVRELEKVYKALVPKKHKKGILDAEALTREDIYFEFIAIISKYNNVLYKQLEDLLNEAKEFESKVLEGTGVNFVESPTVRASRILKERLKDEERRAEIGEKMRDFFAYSITYIAELYEKLNAEKERKKEERKVYEWALKDLSKNRILTPKEIKAITELIERSDIDKAKYYDLLNVYIKQKEELTVSKKEEIITKPINEVKETVYRDKELVLSKVTEENKEENSLITNYINTIYTLKNDEKSLKEFLDGISYNEDFEEILSKIVIAVSETGDNTLIKYLLNYQKEILKQEEIIEEDNDKITVLYYGFFQDKEKILADIEKGISPEDYKDILKALEQIKQDGAVSNRKNIVRIRKVFKLRVNNIRVTFKRISKNVYIVLGIYRKKDTHGAKIIFSTEKRNNHLLRDEKQIISAMEISELWNSYLEKNSEIEDNIINLLKQHVYSV